MSAVHGVPSIVDESNDEKAIEGNASRIEEMYLPEDLLVDIFPRVPLASLARFRSVSKRWKALIDVVRFEKSSQIMLIDSRVYLVNNNSLGAQENIVNVKSQFTLKDPLSNPSKEVNIREVFHCEGLLLCTTEENRLVVWNPCLDETTWIKPGSHYERSDIFAFGKSSCNEYKILRIALHGPGRANALMKPRLYEIYDFTSNSWRVVDQTRDWSILGSRRRGAHVDENTYWLAFSSSQHRWMHILLRFDFSTERLTSMDIPSSSSNFFALSVTTREEQKLCLLAYVLGEIYVWMATKVDSSGAMSWNKLLTVKRAYNSPWLLSTGTDLLVDEENKVIVCPGKSLATVRFLHIVGEDKYIQVDQHDVGSGGSLLLSYAPSLVSASNPTRFFGDSRRKESAKS